MFTGTIKVLKMRNNKLIGTTKLLTTCLVVACLIAGCSSTSNKNSVSNSTSEATTEVSTPEPTIDTEIHTDNLMGIYIGENQSQIGLGLSTDDTKSIIGKPSSKEKKGKTQTWNYKDLDVAITFTKTGDTYTIQSIKGGKDASTLQTGGGIVAGAGKQDVLDAYGNAVVENMKGNLVADNMGYSEIVFTIKNDMVVGITMELL